MRFLGLAAVVVAVYLLLKPKGQAAASPAAGAPPATNSDALDNIMQAIFQKEGGHPGNRNIVNNNPGDVKSAANMTGTAGGYATFADIGDGWDALKAWIQSHISAHPDWDFYDTFDYYLRGSTTAPAMTSRATRTPTPSMSPTTPGLTRHRPFQARWAIQRDEVRHGTRSDV